MAVCVTSYVSVLWDTGSTSLLVEPANRKVAVVSLSLYGNPGSLGWAEQSPGTGLLEEVVAPNTPFSRKQHRKTRNSLVIMKGKKVIQSGTNNSPCLCSGNFSWTVLTPWSEKNCLGNSYPLAAFHNASTTDSQQSSVNRLGNSSGLKIIIVPWKF